MKKTTKNAVSKKPAAKKSSTKKTVALSRAELKIARRVERTRARNIQETKKAIFDISSQLQKLNRDANRDLVGYRSRFVGPDEIDKVRLEKPYMLLVIEKS